MKGGQNLRMVQNDRKKADELDWVRPQPCCICNKMLKGAYGNWGSIGWTCSGVCERIQAMKPPYPNHSEEDFFNRLGERHGSEIAVCA